MLQVKAWKTFHKREESPPDCFVSIGIFDDEFLAYPPTVITEAQAVELIGEEVLEWPETPIGEPILTRPLKVVLI